MTARAAAVLDAFMGTPASLKPDQALAQIAKSIPDVTAADLLEGANYAKVLQKRLRGAWWRLEQKRVQAELKVNLSGHKKAAPLSFDNK